MDSIALYSEFDKGTYEAKYAGYTPRNPRFANTQKWKEHGVELMKVLSEDMLVKEIASGSTRLNDNSVKLLSVHLCYNWKLKEEFILVKTTVEETFSSYTPQYGRDDNYNKHTRCDFEFAGYSIEAFKERQPEIAECLERLR